jgi:hypothetical protein
MRCAGPPRISLDWNVTDGTQPRAAIEPFVSSSSSGRCASFDCKLKECTTMGALARAVAVPITATCDAQHHEKASPAACDVGSGRDLVE